MSCCRFCIATTSESVHPKASWAEVEQYNGFAVASRMKVTTFSSVIRISAHFLRLFVKSKADGGSGSGRAEKDIATGTRQVHVRCSLKTRREQ